MEYFEENFGQNDENNESGFNSVINLLSGLNAEFDEKLNQVQETLSNTLTKEDLNEYQRKIEYLSGLIHNYFL